MDELLGEAVAILEIFVREREIPYNDNVIRSRGER